MSKPIAQIKTNLQMQGLIAWSVLVFSLVVFNFWSLTRGPQTDRLGGPLPIQQIQLAQGTGHASDRRLASELSARGAPGGEAGGRAPAAVVANIQNDVMAEIELPCPMANETSSRLTLGPQVRQLRFVFGACAGDVKSIHNQSNGFEATIFESVGSDYISLNPEQNLLKVEASRLSFEIRVERALP